MTEQSKPKVPKVPKSLEGYPVHPVRTPNGLWRFRATVDVGRDPVTGKRMQKTRVFDLDTPAKVVKAWVEDQRSEVRAGKYQHRSAVTFNRLADSWLAAKTGTVREVTHQGYASSLRNVRRFLGQRQVQSLTRADIEALRSWLTNEVGLAPRSVVYALTATKMVFDRAETVENLIQKNPAKGVKPPQADNHDLEQWSLDEMLRFRATADLDRWAALWRLTLCGLRRSEVCGLRWRDIDFDKGSLRVERGRVIVGRTTVIAAPKSKASKRIVRFEKIHPGTVKLLQAFRLASAASGDDDLVLTDAGGAPIYPGALSDRFAVSCKAAGVPKIRLHSCRHTLAWLLHLTGEPVASAAALLGHSVDVHLSTYLFAKDTAAEDAADRLGAYIAVAGSA